MWFKQVNLIIGPEYIVSLHRSYFCESY
jgi:hypothetical protein